MSKRTVRWCFKKHKYSYCMKRRKGIVTMKDCRKRKNLPAQSQIHLGQISGQIVLVFILMGHALLTNIIP